MISSALPSQEELLLPEVAGHGWPQATAERREAPYQAVEGEAALRGRRKAA